MRLTEDTIRQREVVSRTAQKRAPITAHDPVLQFRKHFVDYVIELAYYIVLSLCIWQEDVIRINSNLPRFIESDTESLLYSSFFNIVENGYADPLSEWNSVAKKILPED
jgi:hypothetical protein